MGTRSLTIVRDEQGNEIVNMYRQFDGYPNGHGSELLERFASTRLTRGFSPDDTDNTAVANGMECLAAQVVGHFKPQMTPGGIYLYPAGLRDCGEEYIYELYSSKDPSTLNLKVTSTFGDIVLYDGTLSEFDPKAGQEKMERIWEKSREETFTDDEVIAAIQGGLETAKEKGVTLNAEQEAFIEDPEQDADVKLMREKADG
jgi:hypothetical protein